MLGMIDEMPTTSYWCVRISSMKRSSVGKSSSVQGASMFAWIIIRPQLRWNIRSENGALGPRHLVVVKLHRVHPPAAVLVVLAVGPEDAGQQHAGLRAGRGMPAAIANDEEASTGIVLAFTDAGLQR